MRAIFISAVRGLCAARSGKPQSLRMPFSMFEMLKYSSPLLQRASMSWSVRVGSADLHSATISSGGGRVVAPALMLTPCPSSWASVM